MINGLRLRLRFFIAGYADGAVRFRLAGARFERLRFRACGWWLSGSCPREFHHLPSNLRCGSFPRKWLKFRPDSPALSIEILDINGNELAINVFQFLNSSS